MTASTKRVMEATNGLVQRCAKGDTKDFFIYKSLFYSKRSAEASVDVVTEMFGMG